MLEKSQAIVIHTLKYSETSVIARLYTDTHGLLSFIVKGVRSPRSKAGASLLQPLNLLDVVLYYRAHKNLLHLREFSSAYFYQTLPFEAAKSAIGLFITEVLHKAIKAEEPNAALFEFIRHALVTLDRQEGQLALFPQLFLTRLSKFLGFYPALRSMAEREIFDMQAGVFTVEEPPHPNYINTPLSDSLQTLLEAEHEDYRIEGLYLARAQRKTLLTHLLTYYQIHVEGFKNLNSPAILEEVFD